MTSIAIIGGLGHVGLPLGLFLADHGHDVKLVDPNPTARAAVEAGRMPFMEDGAEELLRKHYGRTLHCGDTHSIRLAKVVIVCIGTPVDSYQSPDLRPVMHLAENELKYLLPDQLVILRSTVFPGTTQRLADATQHAIAFCPERIVESKALEELAILPQIVSATDERTAAQAAEFFEGLAVRTITVRPIEAELAKLFTNTFRLAQFGIANEFYKIGTELGADYARVHHAMTWEYPRCTVPVPGFAAGPCLRKDALALAAASPDGFQLGRQAVLSNETLVDWLVRRLDMSPGKTVAVLGAAFKPENDDTRDSLSFRLRKLLEFRGARVLMSDPYAKHPCLVPQEEALAQADLVIIATPHAVYRDIRGENVVRIWEAA